MTTKSLTGIRLVVLTVLALTAWLSMATQANARPTAPLGGIAVIGIRPGEESSIDAQIAMAHRLRAKVVRTDVPWAEFQPRTSGELDPKEEAAADRLIKDASADGIKVIMMADETPCWSSTAPRRELAKCRRRGGSRANGWPPKHASDFASFAAELAQRYGKDLAGLEIWNEPDQANQLYWGGPNKAQRYATLVRTAYPAIKAADPKLPVIAGSLVGTNGVFLKALYRDGIKGYYNALSVHFYTLTLAALRNTHKVQLENGDHTPIWLEEYGWPTCLPRKKEQDQACVSRRIQGLNLRNLVRSVSQASWVGAVVSYALQDGPGLSFGVFSESGKPKPAFYALREAFTQPFGSVQRVTLNLKRRGTRVVASGSGPVGDYLELQVYRGKSRLYRTLFTLNKQDRYSLSLPAALGTRHLKVWAYRYWDGSRTAVVRHT